MAWKRKSRSRVKNVKRTMFNKIEFKSLLEKHMYKHLYDAGIPVEYEKHTFTVFDGMVYPQACYEGTKKKL